MSSNRLVGLVRSQSFQAILWRACGASGFIGTGVAKVCNHYGLPVPDPDTMTIFISGALTELIEWIIAWYRNNPNNIIRRMAKTINGANGSLNDDTKTQLAVAVTTIPGIGVAVDTSPESPAPDKLK